MAARKLGICEKTSIRGLGSQHRTACHMLYALCRMPHG